MNQGSLQDAWDLYRSGRADTPDCREYEAALRILDALVADRSHAAEALNLRWHIRYLRGDVDGALDDLSQAIALKPDFGAAHFNRGVVYCFREQWSRARADFEAALRIASKTGDHDMIDAVQVHLADLDLRVAEAKPGS